MDNGQKSEIDGLLFHEIFDLDEIQKLQDAFSAATGVASIITDPAGTPITEPSRFCVLCSQIIRKTDIGLSNCKLSDEALGNCGECAPKIQPCLSSGLMDAGTSIYIDGHHIANWLIGQVLTEEASEEAILAYAEVIGADTEAFKKALNDVPKMSSQKFQEICDFLYLYAQILSQYAYQSKQLTLEVSIRQLTEEKLRALNEALEETVDQRTKAIYELNTTLEKNIVKRNDELEATYKELEASYEELSAAEEELRDQNQMLRANEQLLMDSQLALNKSELQYKGLFKALISGYVLHEMVFDEKGNPIDYIFIEMNPAFEEMTGMSREMAIGKSVLELLPNTEDYWIKSYGRVVQTGVQLKMENYAKEFDKTFEVVAFKLQGNQFAVLVTDVTESRRIKDALSNQTETFKALFTNTPIGIVQFDDHHLITHMNQSFESMFGYTSEEIIGKDLDSLIATDENRAELNAYSMEIIDGGRLSARGQRLRKDKTIITADIVGIPIILDDQVIGGFALYTDVSKEEANKQALMQALQLAEASNVAKTNFLANMSHEIRTPMNGFMGMIQLLMTTSLDEEQKECLDLAKTSGDALLDIVNDILDYSKVESGRMVLAAQKIDIRKVISEIESLFRPFAKTKGLDLSVKVADAVPQWIIGDSFKLKQILSNLVGNGLKFTHEGSVLIYVKPCLKFTPGNVVLEFNVKDTGIGIAEDQQELIFKRFSQVDDKSTREYGGTGLGLAISKGLVELMDGRIWVSSDGTNGSLFTFEIPFSVYNEESDEIIGYESDIPQFNSLKKPFKILIAEDDLASQKVLSILLKRKGLIYEWVQTGKAAVSAFESSHYDMILMDCQMPQMDGFEAARRICALEKEGQHIPIVAMTAYALQGDAEKCYAAGMDNYLSKPIELVKLLTVIEGIVYEKK